MALAPILIFFNIFVISHPKNIYLLLSFSLQYIFPAPNLQNLHLIVYFRIIWKKSSTDHSHMKMYFVTFLKSAPIFFAFLACAEPSSLPATTSNTIDNSWKSKTTTVTDVYAFPALTHRWTYTTDNHVMTTAETAAAFTATTFWTFVGVPPKSKST